MGSVRIHLKISNASHVFTENRKWSWYIIRFILTSFMSNQLRNMLRQILCQENESYKEGVSVANRQLNKWSQLKYIIL